MVSLSLPQDSPNAAGILRPVNLRTDLAPLADLIEIAFAQSMDSGGRAALNEMRTLSRMGAGVGLLANLNEMALGIRAGFVWVVDNKLVGNVSIYPANWPPHLGSAWIIANVAVHPDYQRRGIARRLMQVSLEMIAKRGGSAAILQVDSDNFPAQNLYHSLGFVDERTWTTWRRGDTVAFQPPMNTQPVFIARRRRSEWQAEYNLAQRLRPPTHGGMGWQRPLHPGLFQRSFFRRLRDWMSFQTFERLVVHSEDRRALLASLWIESGLTAPGIQLTLMVEPSYQGVYDAALLGTAVRRFSRSTLVLEHPADETGTRPVLEYYRFVPRRTVVHMRWNAHAR